MKPDLVVGRINFDNSTHFPSRLDVNVKQSLAPTAEHLRLLQEMREEVKNELLHSFNVKSNTFEVAGNVYRSVYPHYSVQIHAIYKINGKEFTYRGEIPMSDYEIHGVQFIVRNITDSIISTLAIQIGEALSRDLADAFGRR